MIEPYFDKAPCLFFSTKDDGTLLEVNSRLCDALHYTKEELAGTKAEIFYTIPTRIFQQTHFFPLLKMQGHAEEIYISLKTKDGSELPVLINAERRMVDDNFENLYAGIIVHNRKIFEDELIAAKKTAEKTLWENTALMEAKEHLQRKSEELDSRIHVIKKQNEELRQFNRVVTHDMQEPVRKLTVFSNMLPETNLPDNQKNIFNKFRRITAQMKDLLSGLQQYIWLDEIKPNIIEFDLAKALLVIRQQLELEFAGVQLDISVQNVPVFKSDLEQMHLLFYHLLSNTIRFRKEKNKATVVISADTVQLNQFRNTDGKYKYIDFLRIQIQDKGMGFNPEYKSQVFDLFKRLHDESGQGIGLSLCKKIVENHDGDIRIETVANQGTTVTIFLPGPTPPVESTVNRVIENDLQHANI